MKLSFGYRAALFAIICAFITVIVMIIILVRRTETARIEAEGNMRLSSIAGRVDSSLYSYECLLDSVAMQVEQLLAMDGDVSEKLNMYFCPETIEKIKQKSDGNCFSTYAAYNDKLYIDGFVPDADFVLDERSWYIGAKKRMGAVNITEPYIDASTGEMCYSISKLLSDGTTIVGLDFNLSSIQQYIEEMNSSSSGTSFIVDSDGMIIGHSQSEYVGRDYKELNFYNELVNKVYMLYGNSFDFKSGGEKYNVFSYKTNYDWYLVVCVKKGEINAPFSSDTIHIVAIMMVVAAAVAVLYVQTCSGKLKAEKALSDKKAYLKDVSLEIKRPLSRIINRADILDSSIEIGDNAGDEISISAKEIDSMLDGLIADIDEYAHSETKKENIKSKISSVNHVLRISLVTAVLLATGVFAFVLNTKVQGELSRIKISQITPTTIICQCQMSILICYLIVIIKK